MARSRAQRRPSKSLQAASGELARVAATAAPTKVEGLDGGGNLGGRLYFEPNSELREQAGYGRAGTYDIGQWKQIALSNPFVTAGLDHVLRPVADARVDVEAAPEESLGAGLTVEQAALHAAFVAWCLERYELRRINKQAAAGALLSGFSMFEPVAELVDCPLLGRPAFALKDAPQRLPNSLDPSAWVVDADGRLTAVLQQAPRGDGQWVRKPLAAERILLFSWKREAQNFAGESQLRSVWYIAGKVMPTLLKLAGVTLQREGSGIPVAVSTDPNAELTPAQREELVDLLANATFHESMSLVMPRGWDIKWVFSPGANKGHILEAWKSLGLVVLQQLGAQQIHLGTDSTGSRSVGETHDARSMAMVREVLSFLADVLNGTRGEVHEGLVRRLVDWNFGPQPAYPKVKLTAQRPELSPADLANAAKVAKEAGLFTPRLDDENSFRERAGFAPITEEEREKNKPAPILPFGAPPAAPVDDEQVPPAAGAGEKDADSRSTSSASNRRLTASAQRGGWVPWRPLRASEQRMELASIDEYLTKQRDEYERQARLQVLAMLAMAAPAIQSAMADGKVTPEEVAAVPLDEKRLLEGNRRYLAAVRAKGAEYARRELASGEPLRAAAEDEQDDKGGGNAAEVIEEADEVMEAQVKALTRRQLNRLRGELEREAIDTLRTGGDASEVVERTVLRQVETGAFKADAGTVTAKVLNVGRDEAARIMGGVASVELTAILDASTCDACRSLDGATAPFNSPEHDRLLPPVRDCAGADNCRCLLAFIPATDGGDE